MKIVFGLFLFILSFFGILFFRHYDGSIIPYPTLWYLFFIGLGVFGFSLVYNAKDKALEIFEQQIAAEKTGFKAKAEKKELDYDKCDFKSGSFSHQVEDKTMRPFKLFAPPSIARIETTVTESVVQSYLVYTEIINGSVYKFISQSFPFDVTALKFYVLNKNISLYIDRVNPEKYVFDLIR